jgi:hypothetical protein
VDLGWGCWAYAVISTAGLKVIFERVEIGLRAKQNRTSNTRVLICITAALLFTLWLALWLQYY